MNKITNIHEVKTNLSKLIEIALLGEEVNISKSGKPIVKLIAYKNNNTARTFHLEDTIAPIEFMNGFRLSLKEIFQ